MCVCVDFLCIAMDSYTYSSVYGILRKHFQENRIRNSVPKNLRKPVAFRLHLHNISKLHASNIHLRLSPSSTFNLVCDFRSFPCGIIGCRPAMVALCYSLSEGRVDQLKGW